MKRRCVWMQCPLPPERTVGYWGTNYDLCHDHAEMLGDDGSTTDHQSELVS